VINWRLNGDRNVFMITVCQVAVVVLYHWQLVCTIFNWRWRVDSWCILLSIRCECRSKEQWFSTNVVFPFEYWYCWLILWWFWSGQYSFNWDCSIFANCCWPILVFVRICFESVRSLLWLFIALVPNRCNCLVCGLNLGVFQLF